MADIFISYSSKDRQQAEQLTELLSSAGLSVWIDKQGIDVATSWSGEIVDAIERCKAFVVLLSSHSVESVNVVKEVSLAAEHKKKILPLDLEPVELSRDLKYHLAGLQRAPMTNIDAIIRAIGKLGLEATQAPTIKLVKEADSRKSIMILPFEDLSPTADNQWFADGIVSDLINALSHIKSIRIADKQATNEFKNYRGQLSVYAHAMHIRYFVQGDVRKFGDQVKVSARLLDIETGDHLWQDSLKGTMNDIFAIQEEVAQKVVEGLKVHLASDEKQQLAHRGTENAEAYELYLKGQQYYDRHTLIDYAHVIELSNQATRRDPDYVEAHALNAVAHLQQALSGEALEEHCNRAEEAAEQILTIQKTASAHYLRLKSAIAYTRGHFAEALEFARRSVAADPTFAPAYDAFGQAAYACGDHTGAVWAFREEVRLHGDSLQSHINLIVALQGSDDRSEHQAAVEQALPLCERRIRLNPDDYYAREMYLSMLLQAGHVDTAVREATALLAMKDVPENVYYNIACVFARANDVEKTMPILRRAVVADRTTSTKLRLDRDFDLIRNSAEFQLLVNELETQEHHG